MGEVGAEGRLWVMLEVGGGVGGIELYSGMMRSVLLDEVGLKEVKVVRWSRQSRCKGEKPVCNLHPLGDARSSIDARVTR